MIITQNDEELITKYMCDFYEYCATSTDESNAHVDYLTDNLTDDEITQAIENYNKRIFGVTSDECRKQKCLLCNDAKICNFSNRRIGNENRDSYEKRRW